MRSRVARQGGRRSTETGRSGAVATTPRLTVSRPELVENGSDARFRDLLYSIFAFASRLQVARARFGKQIGLSPTQYMVLIAVARLADDDAGVSQVAEQLYLSGAFTTIEINKLVKAGLVLKAPHPSDRRRVVLKPSALGESKLAELASVQRPMNDALFRSLDREDFISLHRIMTGLVADADRALAASADVVDGPGMDGRGWSSQLPASTSGSAKK